MGGLTDTAPTSADAPERDEAWLAERQVEILRTMAEVEKRTLVANFVATIFFFAVSQWLPNASDFHIPALMRFSAIALTAGVYALIRQRIARRQDIRPMLRATAAVSVVAGASWALFVAPVFVHPQLHPAAFIVSGGTLIAISLVASQTAAIPHIWVTFGVSYLLTFCAAMTQAPPAFAMPISVGMALICVAVAVFCLGAARQRVMAADMLVENRRLGEDLADALAHAEFLASRDPLTGLYNRRAVFDDALTEKARGDRHHMLLIDIDRFKDVNDRFGHDTGDRMLIGIGTQLRDILRELEDTGHFAARLGGEEFAVFLALEDAAHADAVAERIRAAIAEVADEFGMPDAIGRGSIGITPFNRSEPIGDALQRADNALYRAKAGGRDRVCRVDA